MVSKMPKPENGKPVLAIDLGGTKIITAIISADGGMSPNLPGWKDIPLRGMVREKYGVDTFLVNDASAAALGEHRFGAGKGASNFIYLTVSTGIGGGIIVDGELYTGRCGSAGEVGHMTIAVNGLECACGNTGCWETLASGTAVAREAVKRIRNGEKSSVVDLVGGKIGEITAEKVGVAAQGGRPAGSGGHRYGGNLSGRGHGEPGQYLQSRVDYSGRRDGKAG